MKAFILTVMLSGSLVAVAWLLYRDADEHLCRAAGFDGMRGDGLKNGNQCVYRSRYAAVVYITSPRQAQEWMKDVRGYEEEYRRNKQ